MARILVVSPDPASTSVGGVERFCHLIRDVLAGAGHDVRLAGPRRRTGRWAMRLGTKALIESASVPNRLDAWAPDLMITNSLLSGPWRPGRSRIHVLHGTIVGNALGTGPRAPRRERLRTGLGGGVAELLGTRGAVNVAVADSVAAEARRYYGVRHCEVIPNGVDTAIFRPLDRTAARAALGLEPDARLALFSGRAEPRKSPEVALAACRRAGYELMLAGTRPFPGARNLGLLEPDALATLYAASDCVVMPSRYEGCSYSVLEALACGVPLVTSPVGWVPTLLREVPAYGPLVAEPTVPAFTEALRRVGEPSVSAAVEEARAFVERNCTLDVFAQRWLALVQRVLAGHRSSERLHAAAEAA